MTIILKIYKRKKNIITHKCGDNPKAENRGKIYKANNYFFCDRCRVFIPEAIIRNEYKKRDAEYQEPEVRKFVPKKRRRTRRKK